MQQHEDLVQICYLIFLYKDNGVPLPPQLRCTVVLRPYQYTTFLLSYLPPYKRNAELIQTSLNLPIVKEEQREHLCAGGRGL
jgi:hypothetical protein